MDVYDKILEWQYKKWLYIFGGCYRKKGMGNINTHIQRVYTYSLTAYSGIFIVITLIMGLIF